MALRFRRGLESDRTIITPLAGEPIYVTDTGKLYIGDGTTAGGVPLGDVQSDTSPALGGDLDLNGNDIVGTGNININGTITATGNINIGDDSGDEINIGGQITSNLTPNQDSVYNIGTPLLRWNNIFTTGMQVDGQIDAVAVNASLVGDDSTLAYNKATGAFTGTFTGSLDGDVTGSVFADNSTLLVDGVNGTIAGSAITGNIDVGTIVATADYTDPFIIPLRLRGYDESATGYSASFGRARGTEAAPADLQAGDSIASIKFSDFNKTLSAVEIEAFVDPSGTPSGTAVPGKLSIYTFNNAGSRVERASIDSSGTFRTYGIHLGSAASPNGISFYGLNNTSIASDGARLLLRRSRGSFDVPQAVVDTDAMYRITFGGHDGTSYVDNTYITARVDGTVSTGVVPSSLDIKTTDSAGSLQTNATFRTDGATVFNGAAKLVSYADSTARDAAITAPEAGMMVFITGTSKAQVYDGAAWVDLH